MAATARRYSTAEVIKGPVDIWLDVAAPGAAAELTIDTTSGVHTPESVANPNAIHLGMTKGGLNVLFRPTKADSEADELTSPYRTNLSAEEVVLSPKGALQFSGGASRLVLANKLLLGSTISTPTNKKKLTGGGLTTVSFMTVLAIWANAENSALYEYILLYRSLNDSGLAFDLSRLIDASSDLAFRGYTDVSRASGDQIYQWVVKTA